MDLKNRGNGKRLPLMRQALNETYYTARVTLPERRHRVQTYTCLGVPSTTALTRLTLGFQVRLERRWE